MDDFRPSDRGRSRARRPSRRGSRAGDRWVRRLGVVAGAVLLLFAYSTGVSYGHWTATLYAGAEAGTGRLTLQVTDPPSFSFQCATRVFPEHAISFIRFWDPPALVPQEPLVPAGPGAVKIEESAIEFGAGPYSVDPPGARLGDPMTVHLGPVTVEITSWVQKPGEPGEFVGFDYQVSPSSAAVVLDVKAGLSLTRSTISGAGMWPPVGLFTGSDGLAVTFCDTASQSGGMDFSNAGSIPAIVALEWAYDGTPADPGVCAHFEVRIAEHASGAVLFQGSLCSLLGSPILVAPQLDPGQSLALDLTVTPVALGGDELVLSLVSRVTWWQWTSGPPGSPGAYGWWGEGQGAFQMQVIVEEGTRHIGGTSGPNMSWLMPPDGEDEPAATTTTTLPAATTTTTVPPTTTTTLPAAGGEEGTGTLEGRAWEDLDGNGAMVTGHAATEPAVAGVAVRVFDADGQIVARTRTGTGGRYEVDGLAAGRYRVQFTAPAGYSFPVQRPVTVQPRQWARALGVGVDQIVLDDLDRVYQTGSEPPIWRAFTEFFEVGPGVEEEAADAALVLLPEETPEAAQTTTTTGTTAPDPAGTAPGEVVEPVEPPADDAAPGDEEPPGSPIDPNTQAAKPEEPAPQETPPAPEPPPPGDDGAPADGAVAPGDGEGAQP